MLVLEQLYNQLLKLVQVSNTSLIMDSSMELFDPQHQLVLFLSFRKMAYTLVEFFLLSCQLDLQNIDKSLLKKERLSWWQVKGVFHYLAINSMPTILCFAQLTRQACKLIFLFGSHPFFSTTPHQMQFLQIEPQSRHPQGYQQLLDR